MQVDFNIEEPSVKEEIIQKPSPAVKNNKFKDKNDTPNLNEDELKLPEAGWQVLEGFDNPLEFLCFFDPDIKNGKFSLYTWQAEILKEIGDVKPTSADPFMEAICAA